MGHGFNGVRIVSGESADHPSDDYSGFGKALRRTMSYSISTLLTAATRSIASQARSRLLTLTFYISQLPSPRNRAMAGWSHGYRADLARRRLTPELISSLPGTAGFPPFISFSTSYPDARKS